VWLDPHVPNAHTHVSEAPDVRAIMGLQDMRVGNAFNAYKTCRQVATVWLQCSASLGNHLLGTAIV
jgi:hypothetical protein